jgi:large subunit ribosomal protein L22
MAIEDIRAELRYCNSSAQKVRLVIDTVRGKNADEAVNRLRFLNKAAAKPVGALIMSAIANAEQNFGLNRENLFIHVITADEAPTRKWRRFGARGRFKPLLRRNSHVTVILRERVEKLKNKES